HEKTIVMANEELQQIRFISPVGSVGGGISGAALDEALAQAPHFIACDAGTAGGDVHVDCVLEIAREIVSEHGLTLRTAVIYAEQDKAYLKRLLRENRILPLDPARPISESVIDGSTRIVGMMGVEPLQQALSDGADFVLAGRCSDSALFAAIPLMRGFSPGLAWHAGKVSECGTLVCETLGRGVIFTTVSQDEVTVRPYG